ncbi:MAG: phosphate/phosphite/phosphonate ABC transporter substrate-binding protein [Candidatus Omnitrophica bacterium]|nr:phosphate/phosphite/phosphonate ABC transporter substrate-binding protein [Candidatus Omnitrophota bacterium]
MVLRNHLFGSIILIAIMVFFGCFFYCTFGIVSEREMIDFNDIVTEEELRELLKVKANHDFVFGFNLRRSIVEDIRQYVSFLKYLKKTTGYRFKLRFTREDSNIADDLGAGIIQIAAVGADAYILARKKYGVIPVVRGLNKDGKAEYQSVLITASDSQINKVDDLRGKRFAFGNKTSTPGHLIPRIIFFENGVSLENLDSYAWTGSHYNCATAVANGEFDAGGIQDTLGRELEAEGLIRIFFTSKYYPSSGIAVSKDVSKDAIEKIKQALLDFDPKGKHAQGLYNWDKTEMPNGFTEAFDKDYDELREWAEKLDFSER